MFKCDIIKLQDGYRKVMQISISNFDKMSSIIKQLDWTIDNNEDRISLVNKIVNGDDYFSKYCAEYLNVNISTNDCLSEDNGVIKMMNVLTNYILMGSDKQRQLPITDYEMPDNYYKSNNIVINSSDCKNDEYGSYIAEYKDFKSKIRETNLSKTRQDKMVGEINKDMLCVKSCLLKPIVFIHCQRHFEPTHFLEADYTDEEQIKQILRIPISNVFSEVGIVRHDIDLALKKVKLNRAEKRLIRFSKQYSNATIEELSCELGYSKAYVDKLFKQISKKISKYELKFQKI